MAYWFSLKWSGFTPICVARGNVSWGGKDDKDGELQLWYQERDNNYCLYASKIEGDKKAVCKVML